MGALPAQSASACFDNTSGLSAPKNMEWSEEGEVGTVCSVRGPFSRPQDRHRARGLHFLLFFSMWLQKAFPKAFPRRALRRPQSAARARTPQRHMSGRLSQHPCQATMIPGRPAAYSPPTKTRLPFFVWRNERRFLVFGCTAAARARPARGPP